MPITLQLYKKNKRHGKFFGLGTSFLKLWHVILCRVVELQRIGDSTASKSSLVNFWFRFFEENYRQCDSSSNSTASKSILINFWFGFFEEIQSQCDTSSNSTKLHGFQDHTLNSLWHNQQCLAKNIQKLSYIYNSTGEKTSLINFLIGLNM